MDAIEILERYYDSSSNTSQMLVEHGRLVADKARAAASRVPELRPDLDFIEAAAMLHDIGIFQTDTPRFGCFGKHPYIRHGILGSDILKKEGHPQLALACERHISVGISKTDIRRYNLPLPERDMIPVSIEEQIVCYADKFFSKNGNGRPAEKPARKIIAGLKRYGDEKVQRFKSWIQMFE